MNIAAIYECSIENGPGCRTSVFVSGCTRHCPGCHNQQVWDFDYGRPYTPDIEQYIDSTLDRADGLSILGGEPLELKNQIGVYWLVHCAFMKRKSVWLYTGYLWEEIFNQQDWNMNYVKGILRETDVIVDGPYIEAERDITLAYRGSRNQRIINVPASLRAGRAVLMDKYMGGRHGTN